MGSGYAILVWDGWGWGLVRKNPRLFTDGVDMYGHPQNWWPCEYSDKDEDLLKKHGLNPESYCLVIR